MKSKRIAIVSVLKPVDETRMARKIGVSLAEAGYEVHIAGFKGNSKIPGVSQYPLFNFKRLSWQRLKAGLTILRWFYRIKPDIIITCTHELLLPAVLYKIKGVKVIYDVQENYSLNIRKTNAFPPGLRQIIAKYVELKERILGRFTDHFFLAEQGYTRELKFIRSDFTVLENKAIATSTASRKSSIQNTTHLLFTGTIAETTGIFESLAMAEKLFEADPEIKFTIAGYCHIPKTWSDLQRRIRNKKWINVIGGETPVAHDVILRLLRTANAAFIYYPDVALIENTIPTKLYEYLANEVPVLIQQKENWLDIANKYQAAIPIDHKRFDARAVLHHLKTKQFYIKKPGTEILWKGEASKMLSIIEQW